jgi:oxygen-dependent protoporphyrinogen oxidase
MRAAAPAGAAAAGLRGGVHRLADALAADLTRFGVDVRLGERVADPSSLPGRVLVAAPSLLSDPGRRIVLVTLVLDAPALDAAPRGSGLLVTRGAPGVTARALTHGTAKWSWLREAAAGRHVVRLSYEEEPADVLEVARRDAATLLGVELPSSAVVDAARVEWIRAAPSTDAPEWALGEAVAGSGIAGIVKHADATVDRMLAEDEADAAGE